MSESERERERERELQAGAKAVRRGGRAVRRNGRAVLSRRAQLTSTKQGLRAHSLFRVGQRPSAASHIISLLPGLAGSRGRTGRGSLKTCGPGGVAGRSKMGVARTGSWGRCPVARGRKKTCNLFVWESNSGSWWMWQWQRSDNPPRQLSFLRASFQTGLRPLLGA